MSRVFQVASQGWGELVVYISIKIVCSIQVKKPCNKFASNIWHLFIVLILTTMVGGKSSLRWSWHHTCLGHVSPLVHSGMANHSSWHQTSVNSFNHSRVIFAWIMHLLAIHESCWWWALTLTVRNSRNQPNNFGIGTTNFYKVIMLKQFSATLHSYNHKDCNNILCLFQITMHRRGHPWYRNHIQQSFRSVQVFRHHKHSQGNKHMNGASVSHLSRITLLVWTI